MTKIPEKVKLEILKNDFYKQCCMSFLSSCGGRITWEHSLIYGGKQVQEMGAIIPVCEKHHGVNKYQDVTSINKEISQWIALTRMQDKFYLYPKSDWVQRLTYLNNKYGKYNIKG